MLLSKTSLNKIFIFIYIYQLLKQQQLKLEGERGVREGEGRNKVNVGGSGGWYERIAVVSKYTKNSIRLVETTNKVFTLNQHRAWTSNSIPVKITLELNKIQQIVEINHQIFLEKNYLTRTQFLPIYLRLVNSLQDQTCKTNYSLDVFSSEKFVINVLIPLS